MDQYIFTGSARFRIMQYFFQQKRNSIRLLSKDLAWPPLWLDSILICSLRATSHES